MIFELSVQLHVMLLTSIKFLLATVPAGSCLVPCMAWICNRKSIGMERRTGRHKVVFVMGDENVLVCSVLGKSKQIWKH